LIGNVLYELTTGKEEQTIRAARIEKQDISKFYVMRQYSSVTLCPKQRSSS